VHYIDLMRHWAGAPLERVFVMGNVAGVTGAQPEGLPQTAIIALEYANGVRGCYNFGGLTVVNDDASFGVVGSTGRIVGNPWLPEGAGSYELRTDGGRRKGTLVFDAKLTSPGHLGFAEQLDNFIATVLDDAPNVCPVADAVETHRMMTAIDRSLATGQPVMLAEL
jgi:predicted dehydrogenase